MALGVLERLSKSGKKYDGGGGDGGGGEVVVKFFWYFQIWNNKMEYQIPQTFKVVKNS